MFAGHHKLNNLVVVLDNNKLQACGYTKDILNLEPLEDKFKAFGWNAQRVDGHNIKKLKKALTKRKKCPIMIIADTKKGMGIDFLENSVHSHYLNLSSQLYKRALKQL